MINKSIEILFPFLKKIGKLSLEFQNKIISHNKSDGSIVTEIDIKISDLFTKLIKDNFKDHLILDEEKIFSDKNFFNNINSTEYLWIIDPIDGTKTYFYGSNLFATSISLYRNFKPVFGLIYIPSLQKVIYNDDNNVYEIKNIFTKEEMKKKISFQKKELNKNSLVYFPVKEAIKYLKKDNFSFIDGYSSYIYSYDVLANIAVGAFFKSNISMWDIYGALPIANKLGLKIYNVEKNKLDKEELTELDFSLFQDNLKVKNIWLLCHPSYKNSLFNIIN